MNVPIDSLNNSQYTMNSIINSKDQWSKSKTDIMNWFSNLSLNDKIKATSITDQSLSLMIQKMYQKYNLNKKNKFQIRHHKNDITCFIDNMIDTERLMSEELFLREVRFSSVYKDNDTISLSSSLLNFNPNESDKKKLFIYYLISFSKKRVFESFCQIAYDDFTRTWKSHFPVWYNQTEYYSIGEILTAYLEQALNDQYRLSMSSKSFHSDLTDFYDKRESLIQYVNELNDINELIQEINLKQIIIKTMIKNNIEEKQQKKKIKKLVNSITKSTFQLFEPIKELSSDELYMQFSKRIQNEKEKIVDTFLFCGITDINTVEYYIAKEIIVEMKEKMSTKNYNELMNEFEEQQSNNNQKKKNGKKKKKKKQKKNEENENENKNNNDNEIITNAKSILNIDNVKSNNNDESIINTFNHMILTEKTSDNDDSNNSKENDMDKIEHDYSSVVIVNSSYDNNREYSINNHSDYIEVRKEEQNASTPINSRAVELDTDIRPVNNKKEDQIEEQLKLTDKELEPLKELFYNKSPNDKEISIQSIPNALSAPDKLHNEILTICLQLHKTHSLQKNYKYTSLVYLFEKIKQCFSSELDIDIYGSYSTGLAIESSDIDISLKLITPLLNQSIVNLIMILNTFLKKYDFFDELYPIVTTSVPILRILLNPNKIATQLPNTSSSNIKIDLTFNLPSTKASTSNVKTYLNQHKEIKPLLLIFKKLIKSKQLSSVFEGGLSSHSLFLMTAAYITTVKSSKIDFNIGQFFLDILRFYGNIFNFRNTVIDISKPNSFIINSELYQVPVIIDPITQINVSKSSYRFDKVKELFKETYLILSSGNMSLSEVFQE